MSASTTNTSSAGPFSADPFPDIRAITSFRELVVPPADNPDAEIPCMRVMAYGAKIDEAVSNDRPCIQDNHVQRMSDCRHCSTVALFRIHRDHVGDRKVGNRSSAHKIDFPTLDEWIEWVVMLVAKDATKGQGSQAFNDCVEANLNFRRKFTSPQEKHWAKENLSLDDDQLVFGGGEVADGKGTQRLIINAAGEKVHPKVLYNTAAALLVHEVHSATHCGRDATVKKLQEMGYKPPVKSTISKLIEGCPACKKKPAARNTRKRSRDETLDEGENGEEIPKPATKRSKATPKAAVPAPVESSSPSTRDPVEAVASAQPSLPPSVPGPADFQMPQGAAFYPMQDAAYYPTTQGDAPTGPFDFDFEGYGIDNYGSCAPGSYRF